MKKILNILVICGLFLLFPKISNASVRVYSEEIKDIKLHLKTKDFEKNISLNKISDSKNEPLYSLDFNIKEGYLNYYNYYENFNTGNVPYYNKWKDIARIAYYGYGYPEREDIKWYIVTQYLIWTKVLNETDELYFINSKNEKIYPYEKEIEIINKNISTEKIYPSFYGIPYKIYPEDTLELKDTNNVLNNYDITFEGDEPYTIKDNTISIKPIKIAYHTLKLTPKGYTSESSKIYYNGSSYIINRGRTNLPILNQTISVEGGKIHFNINSNNYKLASPEGIVINIYKSDKTLYKTLTTNKYGNAYLKDIEPGKYTYKVIVNGNFEPYNTSGTLNISSSNTTINIDIKPIKKKLIIKNESSLTKFEIYNLKNNYLVDTFTLNNNEDYTLELPLNTYKIISLDNLPSNNPIEEYITIDNDSLFFEKNIPNSLIQGTLKFTKENIPQIKFKILNLKTNEYLELDGTNIFTTQNGKITINNIPYGDYIIEEDEIVGYKLKEPIYFSIKENNEIIEKTSISTKIILDESSNEETESKPENKLEAKNEIKENSNNKANEKKKQEVPSVISKKSILTKVNPENREKILIPKTSSYDGLIILIGNLFIFILGIYLIKHAKKNS